MYLREYGDATIGTVRTPAWYDDIEDIYPAMNGTAPYEFWQKGRWAKEIFSDALPYPDGQIVLRALQNEGFPITIITTQTPGNEDYTLAWLKKWKMSYDNIVFEHDKAGYPEGDLLLDDKTKTLNQFAKTGRIAVSLTRKWNDDWPGLRVNGMLQFYQLIKVLENSYGIIRSRVQKEVREGHLCETCS